MEGSKERKVSTSHPGPDQHSAVTETAEDLKDILPTERKSMWRTAEERRMSDLTRVLEWLERRQGKKKQSLQKSKLRPGPTLSKTSRLEKTKVKSNAKQPGGRPRQVLFSDQLAEQSSSKDTEPATHRRSYGVDPRGRQLSMFPSNYTRESPRKSDGEAKNSLTTESSQRGSSYRRPSLDPIYQETLFPRKSGLMREWPIKTSDTSYERKIKSLMEKGTEPKIETVKMLKPEEVLSCRYLRLSQNNIKTLLKLCKDAGMTVDIHPHMVETDINAKMVFAQTPSTAL